MPSEVLKTKLNCASKKDTSANLEKIVEECMKNKGNWGILENDILFAATFSLMMECGFTTVGKLDGEKKSEGEGSKLPQTWKHGSKELYEAQFILPPYEEHLVRLVALPADDILCINIFVSNVSPRNVNLKSLAVSSSGFVPRPEANQVTLKFSDFDYFRFHLRSSLIWPIRCSILTDEGVVNGSLAGLSDEIKLKILNLLELRDLLSLSETCHDLNRVCNDQELWKTIFHKSFKSYCKCAGKAKECTESNSQWKENYKSFYWLKPTNENSHSSLESFHTAPETGFYEVDLSYD